jgi:hypothetical protein
MANKSQGTLYVSFELPWGKRNHARATETFQNEREAKQFAIAKLVDTSNVTAGTINPHLPKRTIAATRYLNGSKNRVTKPAAPVPALPANHRVGCGAAQITNVG